MIRNKVWWIVGVGISIAAAYGTYWYFPRAFPIVNVTFTMDRSAALARAKDLASLHKLGPQEGYMQAAIADHDNSMQVYTELEAGGAKVFQDVVESDLYSPYTWAVRHFKPFDTNEVHFFFTPKGELYGFQEKIAETVERPSLEPEQARTLAEKEAVEVWQVPLDKFSLVESSKDTKPNGRTDHSFVYERKERLKEAYYRLTLNVVGDKLSAVRYSVKVPETFSKKYQQMRSANNTIAGGASYAMIFLYAILIGLGSLIILSRRRWLLWRPAMILGSIIAFLMVAMQLNQLPIIWMSYVTTNSYTTFIVTLVLQMCVSFVMLTIVFAYVIALAEGLTRKVFGSHIQFWALWKRGVAASPAVLMRTVVAYLIVPLFLFYVVLVYMLARRYLGWWYPATPLLDPNILATYLPWLQAAGVAVEAGIIEECLFRAVPLAAGAWLGKRYNKRTLFIAIAFVVQCIIFGAAHANYPAQPAYARLIELILVSAMFGGIYLKFGLLTGILSHSLFDFVLGAMPLFLVTGFGALINKIIVVLIGLIPLFVILVARARSGSWQAVPALFYNAAWEPAPQKPVAEKKAEELCNSGILKPWRFYTACVIGVIGLALFIGFAKFKTDAPAFTQTISDVKAHAKELIAQKGIVLDDSWSVLVTPFIKTSDEYRFIWQQKDGKQLYAQLLGSYLPMPGWDVKFIRFNGTIEERAEFYFMRLTYDNRIVAFSHRVIAEAPGATIDEAAARTVALAGVQKEFGLSAEALQEISAKASKQPARTDWAFNFKDKQVQLPQDAQARACIDVTGDSASGYERLVHVPEEWQRQWQTEKTIHQIIQLVCWLILIVLLICSVLLSLRRFGISRFFVKQYVLFMMLIVVLNVFLMWCTRESLLFQFNAQEPFWHQLFQLAGGLVLSLLFMGAAMAGFVLSAMRVKRTQITVSSKMLIIMGVALGIGLAGILALLASYAPSLMPYWGDYSVISSTRPWTSAWLLVCFRYVMLTASFILFLNVLYELERLDWGRSLVIITVLLAALAYVGSSELTTVSYWAISGLIMGVCVLSLYYLLLRYTIAAVPVMIGAFVILEALQQGIQALFPMALGIMIFASVVVAQLVWSWFYIQLKTE